MDAKRLGALVCISLVGCTVEDVIVDTGQRGDTAADHGEPDGPWGRPGTQGPDDTAPPLEDEDLGAAALTLAPDHVGEGTTVVFLEASGGARGFDDLFDVALYGEPDATLQTWSSDGPARLVLVVEVSEGSPSGELLVVLEHADGEIRRSDTPLLVD